MREDGLLLRVFLDFLDRRMSPIGPARRGLLLSGRMRNSSASRISVRNCGTNSYNCVGERVDEAVREQFRRHLKLPAWLGMASVAVIGVTARLGAVPGMLDVRIVCSLVFRRRIKAGAVCVADGDFEKHGSFLCGTFPRHWLFRRF